MERITDESDLASKLEELAKEDAIQKVLRDGKVPSDWVSPDCYDCDQEIPKDRLATGAFRCIHCQTKFELNQRNYKGR